MDSASSPLVCRLSIAAICARAPDSALSGSPGVVAAHVRSN